MSEITRRTEDGRLRITLDQLRADLVEKYGEEPVIDLIGELDPKYDGGYSKWVFDPFGNLAHCPKGVKWVIGRTDRKFFDVRVRDLSRAPYGQVEIYEEPRVPEPKDEEALRIVGHIRIDVCGGRVRATPASVSNEEVSATGGTVVGYGHTNIQRISGAVAIWVRRLSSEEGTGWKSVQAIRTSGDARLSMAVDIAGL